MTEDRVTLRDVYEIMERVEAKVDKKVTSLEASLKEQGEKIDRLEAFSNRALGVLAVGSAFVSLAASWIWTRILGE